jgi:branched-chain amino acid transport system permease protein
VSAPVAWLASPRTGGLLALGLVIVVVPFLLPNAFYFDVVTKVGISAIVCVGLNLLIGYAGRISLGHAGFFGIGAYSSAVLTMHYDWAPPLAMLVGALVAGVFAFAIARPILRLRGHYLAMATLGVGVIISIVLNQEVGLTGGPDGMAVASFVLFGWKPRGDFVWYFIVGGALWVSVWIALNVIDSPIGRALRSLHSSEVAAQASGIDTTRYKVLVFVISAVFASVAGSLFAHYEGFVTPRVADFLTSIAYVVMVVLGGMASTFGAVVGAAIVTALPQLIAGFENYETVIFGLVLMLTMIFMPKGLVPSVAASLRRAGR